ncbi:MAG TPA: hypothetical protein VG144_05605 [Gaiellaceae bacterium]|nr:hypothetical protein [Gaiellaceae bacterium]
MSIRVAAVVCAAACLAGCRGGGSSESGGIEVERADGTTIDFSGPLRAWCPPRKRRQARSSSETSATSESPKSRSPVDVELDSELGGAPRATARGGAEAAVGDPAELPGP